MSSFLASLNIFPETRLWRIRKQPQFDYICGGIATIILALVIIVILGFQLNDVFKRNNATVTHQQVASPGSYLTLTTNKADPSNQQIMIAVNTQNAQSGLFYYQNGNSTAIGLDTCTSNHFASDAQTQSFLTSYNFSTQKCLPLNRDFLIGGQQNSNNIKYLFIRVSCNTSQNCSTNSINGIRSLIIQNSIANPNNHKQLWQNSIKEIPFSSLPNTLQVTEINFVENQIY